MPEKQNNNYTIYSSQDLTKYNIAFIIALEIIIAALISYFYVILSGEEFRKVIIYLGGIFLLPISFLHPFSGFLLLLLGLPFLKANLHISDNFEIGAVDIFTFFYLFVFLLNALIGRKTSFLKDKYIIYGSILYIGMICIGSLLHYKEENVEIPELILHYLKNHIVYISIFFITIGLIKTEDDIEKCFVAIAFSGIILALFAFIQIKLLGKSFNIFDIIEGSQESRLSSSTYEHSNVLAQYFVMTIPLLVFMVLLHNAIQIKIVGYFGTVICLIALFFTFARSAWIATLLPIIAFVFREKGTFVRFIMISLLLIFIMITITQQIFDISFTNLIAARFSQLESSNLSERPEIWVNTLILIKNHLLWGVGLGNFSFAYWMETMSIYTRLHAHNTFLTLAAESGLISMIGFVLLIARVFYITLVNLKKIESSEMGYVYYGLFCSLSGILIMFLVENIFFANLNAVLFFIQLGLMASILKVKPALINKNEDSKIKEQE